MVSYLLGGWDPGVGMRTAGCTSALNVPRTASKRRLNAVVPSFAGGGDADRVPDPRAARGERRRAPAAAGEPEAARPARAAARPCERDRLARPADRGAVGGGGAADGRVGGTRLPVAAAKAARLGRSRQRADPRGTRLPAAGRARAARRLPVRTPARRGQRSAGSREGRCRRGAFAARARALAWPGACRPAVGALRRRRRRAAGGA